MFKKKSSKNKNKRSGAQNKTKLSDSTGYLWKAKLSATLSSSGCYACLVAAVLYLPNPFAKNFVPYTK